MQNCVIVIRLALLCLLPAFVATQGFDQRELQLFDLVEEVKVNFYEFIGVKKDASSAEIRRSFRRLSVKIHPDKNPDDPSAEENFRKANAIYEVLKDEELRKKYDNVLEFGLPDWRMPVFYYRKLRKMSLLEAGFLFTILFTIGHYFVLWGFYIEKKLNTEDYLRRKNKSKKKQKTLVEAQDVNDAPQLRDIFPLAFGRFLIWFVLSLPENVKALMSEAKSKVSEEFEKRKVGEKLAEMEKEAEAKRLEMKELKKKMKAEKVAASANESSRYESANLTPVFYKVAAEENGDGESSNSTIKEGPWDDDEVLLLIRAVKRYPGGTPNRWEKVAAMVHRALHDVTQKAKEVQERRGGAEPQVQIVASFDVNVNPTCGDSESLSDSEDDEYSSRTARRRKMKANKKTPVQGDSDSENTETVKVVWSQQDQSKLEAALREFPKGTKDRWIQVAERVTSKTPEECAHRFKELAEKIRLKKT